MSNTTRRTPQPAFQLPPSSTRRPRRTRRILAIGAATLTLGCVGYIASDEVGSDESVRTASITDVREIVVEVGAGPVSLVGDPGRAVGIRSTLHGSATGTPSADHIVVDGVLRITTFCRGLALTCHVDQDITVPDGIPVTVQTTAGTVDATGLDVPRFQVTTSAGSVTASFARAPQAVRIETAAGNVALALATITTSMPSSTTSAPNDSWNSPPRKTSDSPRRRSSTPSTRSTGSPPRTGARRHPGIRRPRLRSTSTNWHQQLSGDGQE